MFGLAARGNTPQAITLSHSRTPNVAVRCIDLNHGTPAENQQAMFETAAQF